ncbi:hypothetical protein ACFVS2_25275 [Brevibacillus sp. NPDC058079]|uniref:hypothetical protein n=1 Tax=Brevibacillus sp. NPDC058079 TaxID=3346330 RepID=UPI0036EACF33
MVRITFLNYGALEQMFFTTTVQEAVASFGQIFGGANILSNTGGISIVSIGEAQDTKDHGGYCKHGSLQKIA